MKIMRFVPILLIAAFAIAIPSMTFAGPKVVRIPAHYVLLIDEDAGLKLGMDVLVLGENLSPSMKRHAVANATGNLRQRMRLGEGQPLTDDDSVYYQGQRQQTIVDGDGGQCTSADYKLFMAADGTRLCAMAGAGCTVVKCTAQLRR